MVCCFRSNSTPNQQEALQLLAADNRRLTARLVEQQRQYAEERRSLPEQAVYNRQELMRMLTQADEYEATIADLQRELTQQSANNDEYCIDDVDGVTDSLFVALYEQAWEEMRLFVKELRRLDSGKQLTRVQRLKLVYDVLFKDFTTEGFGMDPNVGRSPPEERRAEYEKVRLHAGLRVEVLRAASCRRSCTTIRTMPFRWSTKVLAQDWPDRS